MAKTRRSWNAGRKCKAKTNFAACGQNLVEYAAKQRLPDLGPQRLFALKLTVMVRLGNRTYLVGSSEGTR